MTTLTQAPEAAKCQYPLTEGSAFSLSRSKDHLLNALCILALLRLRRLRGCLPVLNKPKP